MPDSDKKSYHPELLFESWHTDEKIGEGSFGVVYKVSKREMGETYDSAVKVITVPTKEQYREAESSLGDDKDMLTEYFEGIVKNIIREIRMLYSLSGNPNIIGYQDHKVIKKEGEIGWEILIRMEYVTSLRKYLKEQSMTVEEVIRLGIDVCTALETCSKKGIIHRDIKDDNIFVSDDGVFKLGDFGIARELSKSGRAASMRGTPLYMAPEIFRGEKYDAAVDIYSLGIVLYKLLNYGRMPLMPPYPDKVSYQDSEDALEKRMSGVTLPPPSLASGMLASAVLKACAYNAAERYSSPTEMKRALIKAFSMLSEVVRAQVVISAPESSISQNKQHAKTGEPTIRSETDYYFECTSSIFGDQQGSSHQDDRPKGTSATIGIFPSAEEQIEQKRHFNLQLDEEDKKRQKKRKRLATFIALFCVVVGCFFLILRFADAELIYLPADGASASNASASNASASNASASNASASNASASNANVPDSSQNMLEEDRIVVDNGVLLQYEGSENTVIIPDGVVTSIGDSAFASNYNIVTVSIPESVTTINHAAFRLCGNMESINLPSSLEIIGAEAFAGCISLSSLSIPISVKGIGEQAFRKCTSLESMTIPSSVRELGYGVFEDCTALKSITINNGITKIDSWVFAGCTGLVSITLPDSVVSIGSLSFSGCSNLISIIIPDSVMYIENNVFFGCEKLTIYGELGTYAEQYAKENGIPFIEQ